MGEPLTLSPRQSVHKRAAERAAALERLEEARAASPQAGDHANGKPVLQRSTLVDSNADPNGDQQKKANYDVALLQSAIETRELKNQLADAKDEISRVRTQMLQLSRENEKLKREVAIMGSGNAGASRDATMLAEVQMQLVEANAKNEENAGLIQALEEAVAARDASIMRAVNKIKELGAANTALHAELDEKNAELKEVNGFVEEANRKGELAKLVARQYREQAEKLKTTEWKLAKAEEMLRGPSATPSSPLSLGVMPDSPASTPPVIPPKPQRLSMQLQHPVPGVNPAPSAGSGSGSTIERPPSAQAQPKITPASPKGVSANAAPVVKEDPLQSSGNISRSASAAASEILVDNQKAPSKTTKKAPVRSSTLRGGGRYDDGDALPKPAAAAPTAALQLDSPKRRDSKKHKEKKEKKDGKEKHRVPSPAAASNSTPDLHKDESFRTTLATYRQEKERNQLQQSSPAIASPAASALGLDVPTVRTYVDFTQNACKLRVMVHNGVNFPPCSPYIVVRYGKQRRATKIIIKTGTERAWDAEPTWEEPMVFSYEDGASVLTVEGLSKGGASDKPLGSAKINLADYSAYTLPRQFLLVSDILNEHEATTELRSLRLTLDWHDVEAEDRRRHDELARSRGLFDTVRGSMIGGRAPRPVALFPDPASPRGSPAPAASGSGSAIAPSPLSASVKGVSSAASSDAITSAMDMCDGANAQPPDVAKVMAHLRGALSPNVRARNDSGQTYLQIVCIEEHPDMVESLLKKGSAIDNQDNAGLTPLHTACSYGRLESVRALLNAGANGVLADHAGNTPLHLAALQGHFEVVRMLIATVKGISLTSTDVQGLTALHKAAFGGNVAVCELLVDKNMPVNAVDHTGNTPLLLAELGGKTEVSDYLLTKGADFSLANKAGETILWAALARGNTKRASHFMKQFNLSVNSPAGPFGNTLLHTLPLTMEEAQVVPLFTFLIQNGANVNAKNNEDKTPLFHACYKGYAQCAKLLLYAGASATATDKAANTPLHFASTTDVAKLLVPKGAKASAKNKQGNTPLHAAFAFFRKDALLIDYLISKGGGDPLSKNVKGLTPSETLHTSVTKRLCIPHAVGDDALPDCGGLQIKGDIKT